MKQKGEGLSVGREDHGGGDGLDFGGPFVEGLDDPRVYTTYYYYDCVKVALWGDNVCVFDG
jgi:hypothetical protein